MIIKVNYDEIIVIIYLYKIYHKYHIHNIYEKYIRYLDKIRICTLDHLCEVTKDEN